MQHIAALMLGYWNRLREKKNEKMGGFAKKSGQFEKKRKRHLLREVVHPHTRIDHRGSILQRG